MRRLTLAVLLIAGAAIGDETSDRIAAALRIVEDPARPWAERRNAITTLTRRGGPETAAVVERVLAVERARPREVWSPPSAAAFLDMIGNAGIEAAQYAAAERNDTAELVRLTRAARARRVSTPAGRRFVVFSDPWLGDRRDLWLSELDAKGSVRSTLFLGPGKPCGDCALGVEAPDEHHLRVTRTDLVLPGDLAFDRDDDGLTDVVEQRMLLDMDRADTDGDGLVDARDPAPNATIRAPRTDEERDVMAIFEQYFLYGENSGLAVFIGDAALEWRGRLGPTITLTTAQSRAFLADAPRIVIRRAEGPLGGAPLPTLSEGEIAYRIGSGASTCDAVVRRVGARRVLREILNCIAI